MAGNIPKIKSYEQILGQMIRTYTSKIGVNDLNQGSAVLSFFEAFAQELFSVSGDNLAILRDNSLDRAKGDILKRIALEDRVIPKTAKVATDTVSVSDSSISKISTKVFAGSSSVNINSLTIKVSDASLFTPTGAVYIGRGTSNVEGPLNYSSIVSTGTYYEINLIDPTTKFHNVSETVILSQGGVRNIAPGTVVKTSGDSPVTFTTTKKFSILDGEDTVSNIPIAANVSGEIGNVPSNSINSFDSAPFTGATVTNASPITNGKNAETEDELRNRVKKARQSKGLGTKVAIKNSIDGVQALDESAVVTSSEVFDSGNETSLFIDNGEGYEEKTLGVGQEIIVDSALGGELRFQLAAGGQQTGMTKAALYSTIDAPYNIKGGDILSMLVGGVLSEHVFKSSDFSNEGFASGVEVASSVNANPSILFSSRTINNGLRLVFDSKSESDEYIQKVKPSLSSVSDVGSVLSLALNEVETLKLYKNNKPLRRNGRTASVQTAPQTNWAANIQNNDNLIISVDSTAAITYVFTDSDFQQEGTHTTVNKTNSLQSWVNVINTKIVGVTASVNGDTILLTSNLGANTRSGLNIDQASDLFSKGMFVSSSISSVGAEADFTLSRNTLQLKLKTPLLKGDRLTAGTEDTQAQISSDPIVGGVVSIPSEAKMWVLVDEPTASKIVHGVATDSLVDITKQGANIVRFRSFISGAFSNIQIGDYFIIWSDEVDVNSRLEGRVLSIGTQVNTNDYFEFEITTTQYGNITPQTPLIFKNGLVFIRTNKNPQKLTVAAGTVNINNTASDLNSTLVGASVSIVNDENFIIKTNTIKSTGSMLMATYNNGAKALSFTDGDFDNSKQTHYANEETANYDGSFPVFVVDSVNSERSSDNPQNRISDLISSTDLSAVIEPNEIICFKDRYLNGGQYVKVAQEAGECVQIDNIVNNTISIDKSDFIRRILSGERFYVSRGFDLSSNDTATIILDGDASNKTFNIPFFRRVVTNNAIAPDAVNFNAYDLDAGATESFVTFFGGAYSFKNYKVFMKAKNVIDPNGLITQDAVLFRSAIWGKAGERIRIGYSYPTAPNAPISDIKESDIEAKIKIQLKSGPSVGTSIDSTTSFDVTINPNFPVAGVDEVTYTHVSGTAPTLGSVSIGNYITITDAGEFNKGNIGTFKVSSLTASSFTVRIKNGIAVTENNKATLTNNTIIFFEALATTAKEITDYTNANLSDYFIASVLDDSGLTGSGIIVNSTEEDNGFAFDSFYLKDGLNYILSSNISAILPSNQFAFKRPLQLHKFDTTTANAYTFNNSEEIRFVPTVARQINEFVNVLAVTGVSTVSKISTSDRDSRVQFSTNILGTDGAFKSTGGTADSLSSSILGAATPTADGKNTKLEIIKSSAEGFSVGQIVKVNSLVSQKKDVGINLSNNVSITPNSPVVGKSTITLGNKSTDERFFGQPRPFMQTVGAAFHVEKHGVLTYISWDGVTGSFAGFDNRSVSLGGSGSININITKNTNTGNLEINVISGGLLFSELSNKDILSILDIYTIGQTATFEVVGVSNDKKTISVKDNGQSIINATVPVTKFSAVSSVRKGDLIELAAPFDNLNRGVYKVIEVLGNGFYIENNNSVEERVILSGTSRVITFDPTTSFDISVSGDAVISHNGTGVVPNFSLVKMGDILTLGSSFSVQNQGSFMVTKASATSISFSHANVLAEVNVTNAVITANKESFTVNEYESSIVGDVFNVSGDVLSADNVGNYSISEVLDNSNIVVDSILTAQSSVVLSDKASQVSVKEKSPFNSYKKILNKYRSTVNADRYTVVIEGSEQINKINELSASSMTAIGKLGYSQNKIIGIDAYRYYTGLLAEVNRTVYGDPRDEVTYPGVSAAGSEIFIKSPQKRRIEVSVNIRVNTGIPFNKISDQARNNISALVNSTNIGQPIAISDIIASVNGIPGVKSAAISSPQYDVLNDVIAVSAFEKPFIIDPSKDIIVSKIG